MFFLDCLNETPLRLSCSQKELSITEQKTVARIGNLLKCQYLPLSLQNHYLSTPILKSMAIFCIKVQIVKVLDGLQGAMMRYVFYVM